MYAVIFMLSWFFLEFDSAEYRNERRNANFYYPAILLIKYCAIRSFVMDETSLFPT